MRTRVHFLLLLLLPFAVFAQQPAPEAYSVRLAAITSNDGLSQGFVPCIIQDHRGFLWFATKDGLNRYDGYSFTVYRSETDNPYSVSNNFILEIFEDSRGYLWVTTPSGLDVFDPVTERFYHTDFRPPGNTFGGNPRELVEDAFGTIWYLLGNSYACISLTPRNDPKAVSFVEKYSLKVLPASKQFKAFPATANLLFFDQNGGMWIGKEDSLLFVSKVGQGAGTPTSRYNQAFFCGLEGCSILKIIPDEPNKRLFFVTTGGVSIHNLRTGKTERSFPRNIANVPFKNSCAVDHSGNAWIGLDQGVLLVDPEKGFRTLQPLNVEAWPTYQVEAICVDRSGITWLGTNGFSVFRYNPHVARFHFMEVGAVTGIEGDRSGKMYVNSNRTKILFDPAMQRVPGKAFEPSFFDRKLDGEMIGPNFFVQDAEGIYWLGYGHGVLGRYDEKNKSLKTYGELTKKTKGSASRVWLDAQDRPWMMVDSAGKYFIRSFDPTTETFSQPVPLPVVQTNFSYPFISAIVVSPGGEFLFGTLQGLYVYSPKTGKWRSYVNVPHDPQSLSDNMIFSLCFDPVAPGVVWVGTNSGGLNRLDLATGKFQRFSIKDGLPNNVIYGILSDNDRNLWLSTNRGLCRFNTVTHACKNFFAVDGLQGNEFNRYAYYKAADGALYFGGVGGFNYFYPDELNSADEHPSIVFTAMRLFNHVVSFNDTNALISKPIDFIDELVLRYDQDVIALEFAAMDFSEPGKNEFKYMLEGFDNDWMLSGVRHEAIYTGLTPGEYRFVVKAANSAGVWNPEGRSIRIIVLPPWWQTWWARTLFVLFGLGLLAFLVWLRTSSLRRTQAMLEQKVTARTQELNETITNLKLTQAQLVQNEKLASFGQLTAGIAHEIKNPLNFINNFSGLGGELIEELKETNDPEEREEIIGILKGNLEKIHFHGSRVDSIIKSMLDHSRSAGSKKLLTDLNKLCDEYSNLAYHSIRANVPDFSCQLKKNFDYDLPSMTLNPQDISRVLLNMLNNAFYAVNERRKTAGPDYQPEVIITTSRERNLAVLTVYDNGMGISDEMKNKVFKPFYTTKRPGEGTGLGLSISYDIIQDHGGQMQMESTLNEFTRFTIRIPITETDKTPAP